MLTNIHMFLTFWVALLTLFHKYTHSYIDLLFVTFVTMLGGLYLSLINPRKYSFVLFDERYELSGIDRFFVADIMFHLGVFLFVYSTYKNYYTPFSFDYRFVLTIFVFVLYILFINTQELYRIDKYELSIVAFLSIMIYMLLFDRKLSK